MEEKEVAETIARDFALAPLDARLTAGEGVTLDDVRRFLVAHVTHLLERNPGLLMSILYRIDVAEAAVKETFATASPDALPGRLADLIIERQLQKVRLRRSYGGDDE